MALIAENRDRRDLTGQESVTRVLAKVDAPRIQLDKTDFAVHKGSEVV